MSDTGKTIALIKALAPSPEIDPEEVKADVEEWLEDHPEATTTVQDGAITKAKLNASLQGTVDDVDALKSAFDENEQILDDGELIVSSFVQGNRNSSGQIAENDKRLTTYRVYKLSAGDFISVSNIDSGLKVAVAGVLNGSFIQDSGWKTSDYSYTVEDTKGGYYFVNVSNTENTTVSPSDISTLEVKIKNAALLLNLQKSVAESKKIINTNNLFLNAILVENNLYYTAPSANSNYSYFAVNVVSGKSYVFGSNVYYISKTGVSISSTTLPAGTPYTAGATETEYFTVLNSQRSAWAMCESTVDIATVGTYDSPTLSQNILKQESGNSKANVMSQKATTDAITNATTGIKPTNIDGITIKDGTDLLILAEVTNDKYVYVQNNTLKWGSNNTYKTYKIPAKQGTYTCDGYVNFAVPVKEDDTVLDYIDGTTNTIVCPALTEYLYVSVKNTYWDDFKIGYGSGTPTSTKYDFPMLYVNDASGLESKIYGKGYARATGSLSDGELFTLSKTNVKKNNVFSFLAKITSFSSILIGHGKTAYDSSYLVIDGTKITRHNYTSTDDVLEYTHGLTIDDYIYVEIQVGVGLAKVIVYSNRQTYTINETTWSGDGNADIFVESNGSTLTDCVFTWSSVDFRKSVWMFGDSYFSMMAASRWTYYLNQYGFIDNVLLNAYPGEATSGALTALGNALIYYGKPKYIVWCLGMNDGADTNENTPSSSWMNGVNSVLAYCNQYDITPIFATIPSVPTLYHEGKNKWVRESGYRYIDFAKAVGATSEGVWYDGMLSTDEVHPATPGAIALYFRAIADAPEITFSNP